MTPTISSRAGAILRRFPGHLDLADPDKVFAHVVDDLAVELDVAASAIGRIRRNHRIGDVDNEWDLLALLALHDFDAGDLDLLGRRWAPLREAAAALRDDPASAADVRDRLPAMLKVLPDTVVPFAAEPDTTAADQRLADALDDATAYPRELVAIRTALLQLVGAHRLGNGTNAVLLTAAAAHLGLAPGPVYHHEDRFWHVMPCTELTRLVEPADPDDPDAAAHPVEPTADLLAIEENPFRLADLSPTERVHGQRFATTRAGWDQVPVTVIVRGVGGRTHAPMVVNVDTGAGTTFTGDVPDGAELRLEATGRVTLDGAEVTRNSFSFTGAVFADADPHSRDFVFADTADPSDSGEPDDRIGTFAITTPTVRLFDANPVFPHAGGLLDAPTMLVGTLRWAFFVGEGHFGRMVDGVDEPAVPSVAAGRWDDSVFDTLGSDGTRQASGAVGFEWHEREAFAVRLWLPLRFQDLDTDGTTTVRERIRQLLQRFRPAGVHLYVDYADDRWTLTTGIVREFDSTSPIGTVVAGTVLWPDPDPEPD